MATLGAVAVPTASAADWTQYLRDAAHTADARDERLTVPLHLAACVALDDAVLTSPAVVGDRVYVVDQMGSAYCVDPQRSAIVWKTHPLGAGAVGGNTSSPCVVDGKMAYGTTAGNFYLLDAKTGQVLRTIKLNQPIFGAITAAGGRYYLQSLDGVIHCLDGSGTTCWRYDPYAEAPQQPGSRAKRQYSGTPVAVLGDTVVAAVGFDLICLRDNGATVERVWIQRTPITDTYLPVGVSLADGWAFASFPGKDGKGAVVRFKLTTGEIDKDRDVVQGQWAILTPPAIRNGVAYICRQAFGMSAIAFGARAGVVWSSFSDQPESTTPAIAAPTLAGDHCLFTLLSGGLAITRLPDTEALPISHVAAQTVAMPSGAVITSSPAISNGAVYFGSDDGYLYILRSEKANAPATQANRTARHQSKVTPAGNKRYGWPSAFGSPANANYIDDPSVKPPFRLRWATKSGGLFKQAVCATREDVVYVTLGGLVVCREQMTGRIRWRRHLPGQAWCRSALLAADGRIYVPRMFSLRYPKSLGAPSTLYCLSGETGVIQWQAPMGIGDRLRSSPVYYNGVVAFGSLYKEGDPPTFFAGDEAVDQAIDAWDAVTGKPLWQVKIKSSGTLLNGPAGCAGDGVMFFSGGGEGIRDRGQTVALDPRTGRMLWRSEAFASQTGTPSYRDGRVYLPGTYHRPVACLAADTGETLWTNDLSTRRWHVDTIAFGPDYFSVNNKYDGGAWRWDLKTGRPMERDDQPLQLWGAAHGCGAVVLTASGHALSATIGGLCMTDVNTGELAWNTAGFGSYTCPHPIAANGRIFYAPQTSSMLFCFEPITTKKAE
ncbi:MAG: PQQ-binding-like beta-propeller repeat protein [Gammaproteobacteria bacterium]|nr:PQQ-binding-like beta-propeller repeat protein [Gammaproteobacteria bacterium]